LLIDPERNQSERREREGGQETTDTTKKNKSGRGKEKPADTG